MPDLRGEEGGGEFEWAGEEEDGEAVDGIYLLVSEECCVRFGRGGWKMMVHGGGERSPRSFGARGAS